MSKEMTRGEWIRGLTHGKIGVQRGNTDQRWRFDGDVFQVKNFEGGSWEITNFEGMRHYPNGLWFIEGTEMTVPEIEKALGITNLKIVGEDNGK